ncbi:MAG: L-histidine N(alpha)-methyltransferase [Candidatus Latescibacterota bacterium]|nr:MAG: L-histidine N(alpha)-methyltransferase [Candidatus Latescibacterota bacterium]
MRDEIVAGLEKPQKELPCKLFYDERGSHLFEKITMLEEYYLTRTEVAIMEENIGDIASRLGDRCMLIEFGSGSGEKTRFLLEHLKNPAAYVPIDISKEQLMRSAARIAATYPGLDILPVCADYNDAIQIPSSVKTVDRRIVYYPGSTIGNFHRDEAVDFLRRIARICGPTGGLLIGVDLKKDPAVLLRAYNDSQGVTADFNLNVLVRINREFDADFDIDRFRHVATFDPSNGRIELHLVSLADQTVRVEGAEIVFEKGESIWTESSYKFTVEEFSKLAFAGGFQTKKVWTDDEQLFSVQYLTTHSDIDA